MFRIKRSKGSPVAVHYATVVAVRGNVAGWTADKGKAAEFTADVVAVVQAFYSGRANAGQLVCEPVQEPVAEKLAEKPEQKKYGRKAITE